MGVIVGHVPTDLYPTPTRPPVRDHAHAPAHAHPLSTLDAVPLELRDKVRELALSARSANTRRAYSSDWARWVGWCEQQHLQPLPAAPASVAAYLGAHAGVLTVATLRRHLATIAKAHEVADQPSPTRCALVRDVLAGIVRTQGAVQDKAPPLLAMQLEQVLATLEQTPAGVRDQALLLLGWCAALRRSELATLRWGDVHAEQGGLVLVLRGSKTDHAGTGQAVAIPAGRRWCPVQALAAWRDLVAAQLGAQAVAADQPVLRRVSRHGAVLEGALSGQAVAQVIQRRCGAAGLSGLRGHSLRVGLVQSATAAGVADSAIMQTTRHTSLVTMRGYQRDAGAMTRAASGGLLA